MARPWAAARGAGGCSISTRPWSPGRRRPSDPAVPAGARGRCSARPDAAGLSPGYYGHVDDHPGFLTASRDGANDGHRSLRCSRRSRPFQRSCSPCCCSMIRSRLPVSRACCSFLPACCWSNRSGPRPFLQRRRGDLMFFCHSREIWRRLSRSRSPGVLFGEGITKDAWRQPSDCQVQRHCRISARSKLGKASCPKYRRGGAS